MNRSGVQNLKGWVQLAQDSSAKRSRSDLLELASSIKAPTTYLAIHLSANKAHQLAHLCELICGLLACGVLAWYVPYWCSC